VGQAGGLIAALVSLTAAVAGSAAAVDFTLTIPHGGLTRTALVHVPTGAGDPRPVVLNLHDGGNAESHRRWTRMGAAADRRGFVAVYPNGTGPTSGRLLVWNAGTCCGRAPAQGVDDVGFPLRTWRRFGETLGGRRRLSRRAADVAGAGGRRGPHRDTRAADEGDRCERGDVEVLRALRAPLTAPC
jgi:hypothetical protein